MLIILQAALLIFALRTLDVTLATLRMLMVLRGRKTQAWILGFLQAIVFILAIGAILADLNNLLNMAGYAAGFATGNVLGMAIEERLAIGHKHLRIISARRGAQLAGRLRDAGYAVTEVTGRGKDGTVTQLECTVRRRQASRVKQLIAQIDPDAMVTSQNVFTVWHGFWRS